MEEGGVDGLFQRESADHARDSVASAAASSCASAASSDLTTDLELQTARFITIIPARLDRPGREEPAISLLPSLEAIDRMDRKIEEALRPWENALVAVQEARSCTSTSTRVTGQLNERGDRLLTGNREELTDAPNRAPIVPRRPVARGDGQPVPSSSALEAHHRTQAMLPRGARADAHWSAEDAQRRAPSPSPSELSISETVFDVRRPTPAPPMGRSDLASLPSQRPSGLQRDSRAPGADFSLGLRPGEARPGSGVGREEDVPAVLVPGGWLGIGGDNHPLARVSRRRDRNGPDEEEDRGLRETGRGGER
ncbi:hypothetical protein Daus18300_010481 [Diaporthe australafricana]|uniref:Uncharacterized protein n=1 Tax=Diaporthe australafricana TaxID=127596 RepID=A0ABR3WAB5_9PEZI